jgi:hypothetical protein
MTTRPRSDLTKRFEERIAALEKAAQHCEDPEDREIDRQLRSALKAAKSVIWLLRNATVLAGILIGAKLAYDQFVSVFGWGPR